MQKLKAFIPTTNPTKAKHFYEELLGLKLISADNYGMEFDSNGTRLRVNTIQELKPHPFTVLGWDVEDIEERLKELTAKGIVFERYEFLQPDALGIWTAPDGTKVAWFKDADGNLLSLSECK